MNHPLPEEPASAQLPRDGLDEALADALVPPDLPPGFRAGLMAAMLREAAAGLEQRRTALEAEYQQERRRLRARHLRLRRESLALVVALAFTAGAATSLFLPALAASLGPRLGSETAVAAVGMACAAALGAGVYALYLWARQLGASRL